MKETKKYIKYSLEEKNNIVQEYLKGQSGYSDIIKKYEISSRSVLHRWINQYRETGSTYDNRGNFGKNNPNLGKYSRKKLIPEEMSREELIEYVNAVEDVNVNI